MDEKQGKRDIVGAIRRLVELAMPDLRHYYRMTKKAKVVAVYAVSYTHLTLPTTTWV